MIHYTEAIAQWLEALLLEHFSSPMGISEAEPESAQRIPSTLTKFAVVPSVASSLCGDIWRDKATPLQSPHPLLGVILSEH
jgi:hypothetical protein